MLIGLIADIHGNVAALTTVCNEAGRLGIELLINAGDSVGYYYRPSECLKLLAEFRHVAVAGNHEEMLGNWLDSDATFRSKIVAKYGHGLAVAEQTLEPKDLRDLTTLPRTAMLNERGATIVVIHATPWSNVEYLYPDAPTDRVDRVFRECPDADIIVVGHTHYQHMWHRGGRSLVNPGSVGQQRDRTPGAAWAVLNTADRSITFRRACYDTREPLADCRRYDPQLQYNHDVLSRT